MFTLPRKRGTDEIRVADLATGSDKLLYAPQARDNVKPMIGELVASKDYLVWTEYGVAAGSATTRPVIRIKSLALTTNRISVVLNLHDTSKLFYSLAIHGAGNGYIYWGAQLGKDSYPTGSSTESYIAGIYRE